MEASDTALHLFNSQGLLLQLVLRLTSPATPPCLLQACLSTLATVSDSNPTVVEALLPREDQLLALATHPVSLLARSGLQSLSLTQHSEQ